jgi:glycosyltransferase involved in cell wall biosynthesis
MMFEVPILIPAYKPGESLPELVRALLDLGVRNIVVVDDGSGPEYRDIFRRASLPGVHLVEHG